MVGYGSANNRIFNVFRDGAAQRLFSYDAAGNIISDTRSGTTYTYTYNAANRLASVAGPMAGSYVYDGNGQLIVRTVTPPGAAATTIRIIHDTRGNVLAETDTAGATRREYIWLPEAGTAGTDLPLAVVDVAAPPALPVLYFVHTDHLGRPIRMTNAAKAAVWDAVWTPWSAPHAITGSAALDARFPGQWFQLESGLHYNWHRHYDPSLGRYTQPDPLGFVDGPSVYAYVRSDPLGKIDPDGHLTLMPPRSNIGSPVEQCICNNQPGNTPEYPSGGDEPGCLGSRGSSTPGVDFGGHRKNRTPSNRERHEEGDARRKVDRGGEKADWSQGGSRRPPAKRPSGWEGPWPPKLN